MILRKELTHLTGGATRKPEMLEKMRLKVLDMYGTFVKRDYPDISNQSDPARFGGNWSPGWC